ncbi:putative deoxyribonuclease RhsB [Anaerolineales bacterium]|nr:putative deoxyribonuclease RhsB [Anaerolineales bacterium]
MGQPAARIGDMHTCPRKEGKKPHKGGPILEGCGSVIIGGQPAARVGDKAQCDGPVDVIAKGEPSVIIGGRPAARLGDQTVHGGVIVTGCATVLIGPPPQGRCMKQAAQEGAMFVELLPPAPWQGKPAPEMTSADEVPEKPSDAESPPAEASAEPAEMADADLLDDASSLQPIEAALPHGGPTPGGWGNPSSPLTRGTMPSSTGIGGFAGRVSGVASSGMGIDPSKLRVSGIAGNLELPQGMGSKGAMGDLAKIGVGGFAGGGAGISGKGVVESLKQKAMDEAAEAVASKVGELAKKIDLPVDQLVKNYKHAVDFGIVEPMGPKGIEQFGARISTFINEPATTSIGGTFQGSPAVFHVNPQSRLAVVQNSAGALEKCGRLNATQYGDLLVKGGI